jgi:mRNA interferase RelE/StbE
MYVVELSREAERFLNRCEAAVAGKLARCFEALERNPRSGNNIKPLKGELAGAYRYRVGDYRVVYTIDDEVVRVFIITIAHRRDVYE